MSKLKLIDSEKRVDKENNFWNCCPLKKEYLPDEECPEGVPERSKDNRIIKEARCPWWINSPEHNYCFWKFVRDKSDADGSMKELVQSDLAKLFGWSSAKTYTMVKEAVENLVKALKKHELIESNQAVEEYFDSLTHENSSPEDSNDY